ncbi:hypothetical protein, partial [Deinococcus ruber]|uniref:hypothetical protein n=1 Tax=Deinococcus ruber TaxID=1848197 RepID=UPI001E583C41
MDSVSHCIFYFKQLPCHVLAFITDSDATVDCYYGGCDIYAHKREREFSNCLPDGLTNFMRVGAKRASSRLR